MSRIRIDRPLPLRVCTAVFCLGVLAFPGGAGEDCNGNGVPDGTDISQGTSQDCDGNGVPDECDASVSFAAHAIGTQATVTPIEADLDGDGDLDVLARADAAVVWFENTDGAGSFSAPRTVNTAGGFVEAVFASDVDGDGDLDVLIAAKGATTVQRLAWQPNLDGAGTFGAEIEIDDDSFVAVFADDLDDDGDADVLAARYNQDVRWYENVDGAGTFGPARILHQVVLPAVVSAVDIDGDGDRDVFAASINQVFWHEHIDGDGWFGPARPIASAVFEIRSAVAADLDGDGDPDALTQANLDDEIVWYENLDGTGTFGTRRVVAVADAPFGVDASDVDGDGDLDVIAALAGDDRWSWYENLDGAGTFGAENPIGPGDDAVVIRAADIDRDGNLDALTGRYQGPLGWHENLSRDCDANGTPDDCDLASDPQRDCNANGVLDACDIGTGSSADCNLTSQPDECDIASGASVDCSGNGTPDECEPDCNGNAVADDCDIATASSTDCNGNGIPDDCEPDCNENGVADPCDIAAGTSTDVDLNGIPDECVFDCNANGVDDEEDLINGTSQDCNGSGAPDECDIAAGFSADCDTDGVPDECQPDCNGNEIPDVCDVATGSSADCDGNLLPDECDTARTFGVHDLGYEFQDAAIADLDADGDPDILTAWNNPGALSWFENEDGAGSFGPQQTVASMSSFTEFPLAADLDGDGDTDAIGGGGSSIEWVENLGGSFGPPQSIASGYEFVHWVSLADMDGDGDTDVLAPVWEAPSFPIVQRFVWFPNDGTGGFGQARIVGDASGQQPQTLIGSDLDGDGDTDALAALFTPNEVVWYELTAGHYLPHVIPAPQGPRAAMAADLDGDGDPDVVAAADAALVWYENTDGAGTFGPQRTIMADTPSTKMPQAVDLDGDGDLDLLVGMSDGTRWFENLDGFGSFADGANLWEVFSSTAIAGDLDGDLDVDVVFSLSLTGTGTWHEALADDCNGNGIPDGCEDCDGTGIADACELAAGVSLDCNGNDLPDTCDTTCTAACDGDGDLCLDDVDGDPSDPLVCGDSDGDSCDDCSSGQFAPGADGPDADADGRCDPGDCAITDAKIWSDPGPAEALLLARAPQGSTLTWLEPQEPGALQPRYDTLRSPVGSDFQSQIVCVETADKDRTATDPVTPPTGSVLFYLVRVKSQCPGGTDAMGADSAGQPRSGAVCP